MPVLQRIAIVVGLWLLAGVLCSIFSDVGVEAGQSEWEARFLIIFLTPLLAAAGIATVAVGDDFDTFQQRYQYLSIVWWIAATCFATHAVVTLTRQDKRQFMALVAVQVLILGGSVACVIGFFRHLAEAGR